MHDSYQNQGWTGVFGQSVRPDSLLFLVGLGVREYLDASSAY